MKLVSLLGAAAVLVASVQPAGAQWIQNPINTPQAPGCPAGYSWTKSGVRYQCMTPGPSCQYGFSYGPVWTGSSWSYSCNAPPAPPVVTPPPATQTPQQLCATRAGSSGITLGPNTRTFHPNPPYTQRYYDTSTGPTWTDFAGRQGNSWMVTCYIDESTGAWAPDHMNPFIALPNQESCYACGGGT